MTPCRACGEPMTWAITEAGRRMPLNVGPDPKGNVVLTGTTVRGVPRCRVLKKAELDAGNLFDGPSADPRYMPHKATCQPKART